MLLQTNYIPPADYFGTFARLGEAIANLIDPDRRRREEFRQFLMEHPEFGTQLAERQRAAEGEATAEVPKKVKELKPSEVQAAASARAETPARVKAVKAEAPNVMKGYGFKPGQAKETLEAFAPTKLQTAETEAATSEAVLKRMNAEFNKRRLIAFGEDQIEIERQQMEFQRAYQGYVDTTLKSEDPELRREGEIAIQAMFNQPANETMLGWAALDAKWAEMSLAKQLQLATSQDKTMENFLARLKLNSEVSARELEIWEKYRDGTIKAEDAVNLLNDQSYVRSLLTPRAGFDVHYIDDGFFKKKTIKIDYRMPGLEGDELTAWNTLVYTAAMNSATTAQSFEDFWNSVKSEGTPYGAFVGKFGVDSQTRMKAKLKEVWDQTRATAGEAAEVFSTEPTWFEKYGGLGRPLVEPSVPRTWRR